MAFSFFALLDDIATLLDDIASMSKDVATMTKVAGKKTAGILGDDLAVNAEKATGFVSSRELPVIWKITKGSFLNKLIILPLMFLLSAFIPKLIIPILLVGGAFLTFEGVEKIYEFLFHKKNVKKKTGESLKIKDKDTENKRIRSAIIIDFILSLEIIIITLSVVVTEPIKNQIIIVSIVAFLATIGVYGLVALIVRIDDVGLSLVNNSESNFLKSVGKFLIKLLPIIIKILIVVGTIAMILVGGGIFHHNVHFFESIGASIPTIIKDFIIGIVVGIIVFTIVSITKASVKKLNS